MDILVRKAVPGDEAKIAEVHVAAWKAAYREFMSAQFLDALSVDERTKMWKQALQKQGKGKYLIVEKSKHIRGFAVYGPARDEDLDGTACELVALNIHPDCWREKLGTSLLQAVFTDLSHEKYETIYLWVINGNKPAINLYEQFGFRSTGVSKTDETHCGNPIHETRYSKALG